MPDPTIIRVCDGTDVLLTDGRVLHLPDPEVSEDDIAAAVEALPAPPEPSPGPAPGPEQDYTQPFMEVAGIVGSINTAATKAVIVAGVKAAQAVVEEVL